MISERIGFMEYLQYPLVNGLSTYAAPFCLVLLSPTVRSRLLMGFLPKMSGSSVDPTTSTQQRYAQWLLFTLACSSLISTITRRINTASSTHMRNLCFTAVVKRLSWSNYAQCLHSSACSEWLWCNWASLGPVKIITPKIKIKINNSNLNNRREPEREWVDYGEIIKIITENGDCEENGEGNGENDERSETLRGESGFIPLLLFLTGSNNVLLLQNYSERAQLAFQCAQFYGFLPV